MKGAGRLGPREGRRAARRGVGLAALLGLLAVLVAWLVPLPERLTSPGSPVVLWRDGGIAHAFLAPDERWRIPVRLEEVDPDLLAALLTLEDRRFRWHLGVDGLAVLRAIVANVTRGGVVSGASTITMQVVRLTEPRPRTLRSKGIEALRAVQLELRWSKREILQAWLQFTPYGRNVEGIEAASLAYFGHGAQELSPAEIATLLAVPQNPNRRFPTPGHEPVLRAARDGIARRLLEAGALPRRSGGVTVRPEEVAAEVAREPVPTALRPLPREAAAAAGWLRGRAKRSEDRGPQGERTGTQGEDGVPEAARAGTQEGMGSSRLPSTLDRSVQAEVDRRLAALAPDLQRRGIEDAAVVVLDRRTRDVLALGNLPGRFIPAFDVPRSPGSTLKPLLLAVAVDRGLALPEFLVADVPASYGSWSPSNYDGDFEGLVPLDEALSRSLNLPFVGLLREVGVEPFLGTLRALGMEHLAAEPGHYGLSVVIGGVEVTPLELAGAYATLADGGTARRPRLRLDEEPPASRAVLGAGASWRVRRILERRDRPDFPRRSEMAAGPVAVHWKTGTSSGRRDAWAVGSGPDHTVAVWMGNLDQRGSSYLVGADTAGPLLFDVLEALRDRRREVPLDPVPGELAAVPVCVFSGHPPGPACGRTVEALARVDAVPTALCPYHVTREVDVASGLAVRPDCRGAGAVERRTFVSWPSTVRRFVQARHRHVPEPPSWAPGCAPERRERAPSILSPPADHVALLIPGLAPDRQQIPLEAEAAGDARLSWFVNGEFLGTADPSERLWWTPLEGRHEVVVTDETGRAGRRTLEVRAGL